VAVAESLTSSRLPSFTRARLTEDRCFFLRYYRNPVPALGVGQGEPSHEAGEVAVGLGAEEEVKVVGHEAVGEELDGVA
jgi:hypothetical protein